MVMEKCPRRECKTNLEKLQKNIAEREELEQKLSRVEGERDAAIAEKRELTEDIDSTAEKLRDRVKELERKRNEDLIKIQHLEEVIIQLKEEIQLRDSTTELQERYRKTLYVAQAAYFFQQAICCAVLPGTFDGDTSATIKEMVKYLKPNGKALPQDAHDDIEKARRTWDDMRRELNWTNWDYTGKWDYNSLPDELKGIITLIRARVPAAHPPRIELKTAMTYVKDLKVPERTIPNIKKFVGSVEGNMRRCHLSHEGIEEIDQPH